MKTDTRSIPEIRMYDKESRCTYLRGGVVFALFFGIADAGIAEALSSSLDIFLGMVPQDTLRWAAVGATSEEWKPFTKTTIKRCKAQLAFSAMKARDLTAFQLRDGERGIDAPQYGIEVFVDSDFEGDPDQRSLLQMYFPGGFLREDRIESFVSEVESIAAKFPFSSGYCSPSLFFAENQIDRALRAARGICMRHHGFDIQFNEASRFEIGNRVRGARWINFLSREIVEELGGATKLQKLLPKPISLKELSSGFVIRTSSFPEIGDTNRGLGTPLLSKVALALEPMTHFGEQVLLSYPFANENQKTLSRWERRFLD